MWKQYLIGVLVVGLYIGHDLWKRNANPLNGLRNGAEFVDDRGKRFTCSLSARSDGAHVIVLLPTDPAGARGGM